MSFAEFTRARIFVPLGMTHTSWRDDHSGIVKRRAIACSEEKDGFHTMLPFEDVYGNSSLLTTSVICCDGTRTLPRRRSERVAGSGVGPAVYS